MNPSRERERGFFVPPRKGRREDEMELFDNDLGGEERGKWGGEDRGGKEG